ncbi:hypothetical protein [Nonomuraea sp. NEAU-A123]|uniref:hypothetical protein n=1 Tax=Nonomuraea sp. NEAU-A123 TaxID=2839649 RepID=UPI001BE49627|nr:hypothetical protein [Nonomuraea sp. NEAU-A123]MBT2231673.1 hypothetical protein [Nonomuraea sp. NEAU-A123]
MAAIDDLLCTLRSIERAIDALQESSFSEPAIRAHLMRGIAVNGLVSFEAFMRDRMKEWVAALTTARIAPIHLPGGSKRYEDRIVEALPRSLRDCEPAQRAMLLQEIGKSLTSLSTSTLVPHELAFKWIGSNIQVSDIESMFSLIGLDQNRTWPELTFIWDQVVKKRPENSNLKNVLTQVIELRHEAAHAAMPVTPIPILSTIPRNVKLVAVCIDTLMSRGIRDLSYNSGPAGRFQRTSVQVRKILQVKSDWAEYSPGSQRALRRYKTFNEAMQAATARARVAGELVLASNALGEIVNWSFAGV